jgi:PhzF family phenazine biosynthesis protein
MKIPIFQIDAFTSEPFKGNPAAVCLMTEKSTDAWMQQVAMEMNLSETAFLLPEGQGWRLRWFTPLLEVDLCGHATLASTFVLFQQKLIDTGSTIHFFTRSGELTAFEKDDWITLDFPAFFEQPYPQAGQLAKILKINPIDVIQSGENVIVEMSSEKEVRSLYPDFSRLIKLPMHGLVVTAHSDQSEFDFISRYFAPWVGINEDPVTGSAHACLGPYWQRRLGKSTFRAFQASNRGGVLGVEVKGERVLISGQAVLVLSGEIIL